MPNFTETPDDVSVYEGEKIVVKCEASGNPKPWISWYKGSKRLQDNSRFVKLSFRYNAVLVIKWRRVTTLIQKKNYCSTIQVQEKLYFILEL